MAEELPPREAPDPGDRFVTLARCPTDTVAEFVRSLLDQAGIESVLQDRNLVQMLGLFVGPVGGVKVQVRRRDVPAAIEVLRHPPRALAPDEEPALEEPAGAPGPRCPSCGSSSATFEPAAPEGFLLVLLEQVIPLPFLHGHWACGDCGKRWLEVATPRG